MSKTTGVGAGRADGQRCQWDVPCKRDSENLRTPVNSLNNHTETTGFFMNSGSEHLFSLLGLSQRSKSTFEQPPAAGPAAASAPASGPVGCHWCRRCRDRFSSLMTHVSFLDNSLCDPKRRSSTRDCGCYD